MLVLGSLLQRCRLCKFASVCIGECTTLERPNFLGPHDTRLAYRFAGSWVVEDSVRESWDVYLPKTDHISMIIYVLLVLFFLIICAGGIEFSPIYIHS